LECEYFAGLDNVVILGERHLHAVLRSYALYYNARLNSER
jgi:hypothetical protein